MSLRKSSLVLSVVFIAACASNNNLDKPSYGPTLADLPVQVIPDDPMPVPLTSLDEVEDSYHSALEVANDPEIRHRILIRLADIEMARSENAQVEIVEQREFFTDAISMYKELLALNAERQGEDGVPSNERLLYQLSKAYALDGRIEESNEALSSLVTTFPSSAFGAEADFRQAELAFTNQDYALAERLYAKVMSVGDETPFYTNSVYMHGWTRFKQGRYRASIPSFAEVLDRTLVEGKDFETLSNSQKNLTKDTLRILSIAFSYLDGAQTISDVFSKLGVRHYQYMLYANLGELFYEKDRFRDSADTYLHYVKQFPDTEYSPAFSVKAIDVYQLGNFPSLILPAKEEFVRNYGAYSDYWAKRDDARREKLKPTLKTYIVELSSYHHAEGQALDDAKLKYAQLAAAGKKPKKKPELAASSYLRAAKLYGEYVFTFPQDAKTPEMTFLQAEAYYSAGYLPEAVDAYEIVAYQYQDKKRGADAGYAAIVSMSQLLEQNVTAKDSAIAQEMLQYQARKINSAVAYSNTYPADKRAVPVLTKAAQELFEQGDLPRAASVAERLTIWQPVQIAELRKTAWLILAHSRFELDQFADAEWAYRELLTLVPVDDPLRNELIERVAASIYRQAEFQVAAGDRVGAVARLLTIRDVAPNSEIAITAHYDAINYLIEMTAWAQAEVELNLFADRYPKHELAATLQPKYALVFQESEQWAKAAAVLSAMSKSGDPEAKRTSLYLAAELYERSGDLDQAIVHYREYAHTYADPFDLATEARYHMVDLYEKTQQPSKKDFWLNKLIEADASAGSKRTNRSRSLAAMAMSKFAYDEYRSFERIKLTLPIKKSMKKKKRAMDKTLSYYKKIMDFGIAEYVTEANHRIAMIYATLSTDLMDSQRPNGLDALTLDQYEILLEEQAVPFEEKAIGLFKGNTSRSQKGIYDTWVKESFTELAKILPARFGKKETVVEVSNAIN